MIFLKLLSRLPLRMLYALTDLLFFVIYHIWHFRRKLSLANLQRSFPDRPAHDLERIARDSYHNACDMIAEVLKGASMDAAEIRRRMHIKNIDVLTPFITAKLPHRPTHQHVLTQKQQALR